MVPVVSAVDPVVVSAVVPCYSLGCRLLCCCWNCRQFGFSLVVLSLSGSGCRCWRGSGCRGHGCSSPVVSAVVVHSRFWIHMLQFGLSLVVLLMELSNEALL